MTWTYEIYLKTFFSLSLLWMLLYIKLNQPQ